MRVVTRVVTGAFALAQVSCASSPDSIEARYVSPTSYGSWDCAQLFDEKARVSSEVTRISDLQRENANTDTAMVAVGAILFWPALFALAATKDRGEELGRLKGENDAVDQNLRAKQCSTPAPTMEASTTAPAAGATVQPAVAMVPDTPAAVANPAPTAQPASAEMTVPPVQPSPGASAPAAIPVERAAPPTMPPEASAATSTPAAIVDPDEVIVCQETSLVLSRTRGKCLAAGGSII